MMLADLMIMSPGIPELVALLQSRGTAVFLVSGGFRFIIHAIARSLDIPTSHVYANTILFKVSGVDSCQHCLKTPVAAIQHVDCCCAGRRLICWVRCCGVHIAQRRQGSCCEGDQGEAVLLVNKRVTTVYHLQHVASALARMCGVQSKYGYKRVVMVGDGATDLEARQPEAADIFIGCVPVQLHAAGSFSCTAPVSLCVLCVCRYGGAVVRPNIAAQSDWYVYQIQELIAALSAP